jgi:hypothetical protein
LLHPYQKLRRFRRQHRDLDLQLVREEGIHLRVHRHQILVSLRQTLDALRRRLVLLPGDQFHLQVWFPVLANQVLEFQVLPYLELH